jgi:integrase
MGHLFKPVIMKPLPPGAEIVERDGVRTARWRNRNGKLCTAEVRTTAKGDRAVTEGAKWMARFKDGSGLRRTIPTGCADIDAAKAVLAEHVRRAELVKSGVISPVEDNVADNRGIPIAKHVESYAGSLRAGGATPKHVRSVQRRLTLLFAQARIRSLKDITRDAVEKWILRPENERRSTRTRNTYVIASKSFCAWAVATNRLMANPLAGMKKGDEKADRRRVPRAFTPEELQRLMDAARRRPLEEAQRVNRGWRKGQLLARVRPETRAKLERLGQERALAYKVMALTGLRLGELAAIRVCDVVLSGARPHIALEARHEKNREGSLIPLRGDLVADLRLWVATGEGPSDRVLFRLNENQVKTFDRDLRFAGIAKRDERGRVACVHSLRHTFASLLVRGGVQPRVAQAALRHSDVRLTLEVYTDPKLLDVEGALDVLPELTVQNRELQRGDWAGSDASH